MTTRADSHTRRAPGAAAGPRADAASAPVRLFVYGSLKQGFPNAHVNTGRRVEGRYRTHEAYPMLLLGEGRVPCLVNEPGHGMQVQGELYEVDAAGLAAMDRLERLGERGGYQRLRILVAHSDAPAEAPVEAHAYLKDAHEIPPTLRREGPFAVYTLAQSRHLFW